jgi:SAM-dependent methyltransferase/4-hydroxybenzoate polyprenyltransferase
MIRTLKKYALVIRPYTLINIAILSILPTFLLNLGLSWNTAIDVLTGILFWVSIILGKEIVHKETDKREKINLIIPLITTIMLIGLISSINFYSLILLPMTLVTFALYSLKNKNWLFAPFSFLFRGFLEMLLLLLIMSFYIPLTTAINNYSGLLLAIFLVTDSRNLIGDLRDKQKDKYTFPKKFGETTALILSAILLLITALTFNITVSFPLIVTIILMIFLKKEYYNLHKIYVISTGFFLLNIISLVTIENTFLTNLGFLIVLFNFSYDYLPRSADDTTNPFIRKSAIKDIILLLRKMLTDKRFRNDIKALKIARKGYTRYAWDTLKSIGANKLLENGASIKDVAKEHNIRETYLLEYLLDLLVGSGYLSYKDGTYKTIKEPLDLTESELNYMKVHYPASFKWTFLMVERAKETLLKGKKHFASSFDEEESARLWDQLMLESPFSFRKIAIKTLIKDLKPNETVLDIGCGTGASLFSVLDEANFPVFLNGTDTSKKSLEIAGKKITKELNKESNKTRTENLEKINLFVHDFSKKPLNKKYNHIFLSFVINHIPKKQRLNFYRNIANSLEKNGTCVIYQLVSASKFKRVPMWVMHNVPTHQEFPFFDEYINELQTVFSEVDLSFNGLITKLKK